MAEGSKDDVLRRIRSQGGPVLHDVVTVIDLTISPLCEQLESCGVDRLQELQGKILALRGLRRDLSGEKRISESSGSAGES